MVVHGESLNGSGPVPARWIPPPSVPEVTPGRGGVQVTWAGDPMSVRAERFVDSGKDSYAEISVYYELEGKPRLIAGPLDLNLKSPTAASTMAKTIIARATLEGSGRQTLAEHLDIQIAQLQASCLRWWRSPPAAAQLGVDAVSEGKPTYLIDGLIEDGATTTVVADGGAGKSYLALGIAASLVTGDWLIPKLRPMVKGPVLYLDFEWDKKQHDKRLWQIGRGAGRDDRPLGIWHVPITKPLRKVQGIDAHVDQVSPVLIIVDSLGFALGGDVSDQELVTEGYQIFRSWGVPVLVLHHENKDGGYFGSVYVKNSTRSLWLMNSNQIRGGRHLHLKNDKVNSDETGRWFDLDMRWSDDSRQVNFYETIREESGQKTPAEKVRAFMTEGKEATGRDVARAVDISPTTASNILQTTEYENVREGKGGRAYYRRRVSSLSSASVQSSLSSACPVPVQSAQGALELA